MKSGKNLGIAYSVKKKAKGGRVHKGPGGREATEDTHGPTGPTNYRNRNKSSDMDHGQRRGPEGYGKYQEQAQNQKGVHTPVSGVTGFPGGKGRSEAGKMATETYAGKPHRELRDHGKDLHKKKLKEMRSMPKPNLPMAEGGMIDKKSATTAQRGPKTIPLKHPSMQQSPVFRTKLRDQEDDLEMLAKGGNVSPKEGGRKFDFKHRRDNETGVHRSQTNLKDKGMSEMGADVRDVQQQRKNYGDSDPERHDSIQNAHKQVMQESRKIQPKLQGLAEGGEISDIDGGAEESMDHEDSMADAIMARRDRLHEEIDSGAHDLDSAVRMAEGGEVDIDENAEEQPNEFYDLNEDAALKENYDSDMDDVSQPKDSNEHGHMLSDEDEHDMVDKIRSGMKKRQR